MSGKIKTSIQYQLSNVKLFNDIFYNWNNFNEDLSKGPEVMKERLFNNWNELKDELKNNENLIVEDLDKKISKDDFDITVNKTKKGTHVFFFKFPDCDFKDAASKYVALVLAPKMPRFITLEYLKSLIDDENEKFVIGEFLIEKGTNNKIHNNYETVENDRLTYFAGYVLETLEADNL